MLTQTSVKTAPSDRVAPPGRAFGSRVDPNPVRSSAAILVSVGGRLSWADVRRALFGLDAREVLTHG